MTSSSPILIPNFETKKVRGFIVICGNDGTGKTSTNRLLNQNSPRTGLISFERSTPSLYPELQPIKTYISPKLIDKVTFIYCFEQRPDIVTRVNINGTEYPVFWIMLDAEIPEIERRIQGRMEQTIYQVHKCLYYYQAVYRQLAYHYGIPLVPTDQRQVGDIVESILMMLNMNLYSRVVAFKDIAPITVQKNSLQELIRYQLERSEDQNLQQLPQSLKIELLKGGFFHEPDLQLIASNLQMKNYILSKWVSHGSITRRDGRLIVQRENHQFSIDQPIVYYLITQDDQTQTYRILTQDDIYEGRVVIATKEKPENQKEKEIAEIRTKAAQMFLEVFKRNEIPHSHLYVNSHGVIVSRNGKASPVETVVTQTHRANSVNSVNPENQQQQNKQKVYAKFYLKNPKHLILGSKCDPCTNPYYHTFLRFLGQEKFRAQYLHSGICKTLANQVVYPEEIEDILDVEATRKLNIKLYCSLAYYLKQVGLKLNAVKSSLDRQGRYFLTPLTPESFQVQEFLASTLSEPQKIAQYKRINSSVQEYLLKHRFHETQLLEWNDYPHRSFIRELRSSLSTDSKPYLNQHILADLQRENRASQRQVIVTIDLHDGCPVLVKSSKVFQTHSEGSINKALKTLELFDDILLVDLNGAFGSESPNRALIKKAAKQNYNYTGGGIRTIKDVDELLSCSVRRVVVSSNTTPEFLDKIPKNRLIVELSVNEKLEILIEGRKVNTHVQLIDKAKQLIQAGVEIISITFVQAEGHLNGIPRDLIRKVMCEMPRTIQGVIFAGGITTMDDLRFLWSMDKVIPQLGSAIWKGTIPIAHIFSQMVLYDSSGICPVIVFSKTGILVSLETCNREAIIRTCQTKILHVYDALTKTIVEKPGFQVVKVSPSCSNKSLLFVVEASSNQIYCNKYNSNSCYRNQSATKTNLQVISDHIKGKIKSKSYTGVMQSNPGLALAKVLEEFWEIICAPSEGQIHECSDFLVHFLMYLNGKGLQLVDIINELNSRSYATRLTPKTDKVIKDKSVVVIGILSEKYFKSPDCFLAEELGIKLLRPTEHRVLKIDSEIIDQQKYDKYFKGKRVSFLPMKAKDMPWMIAFGAIDCCVTYSPVMDNYPAVSMCRLQRPVHGLRVCLIKRKGEEIDPKSWSSKNKCIVACEHVNYVNKYFLENLGIGQDCFTLSRIVGSSQSYLITESKIRYTFCDAVVETGATVQANNLEIWKTIKDDGEISIGLYYSLKMQAQAS